MAVSISLIAAVAENGVIGRDNDMPWKISSDLNRFKALTMGKPVVMGRKTFQSIGRALPGRKNIVVTRDSSFTAADIQTVHSLEDGLELAREHADVDGANEIMVIGGGALYAEAMPLAERLYITRVHAQPDGDTHFPEIDPASWEEISNETCPRGERDTASTSLVVYRRTAPVAGR